MIIMILKLLLIKYLTLSLIVKHGLFQLEKVLLWSVSTHLLNSFTYVAIEIIFCFSLGPQFSVSRWARIQGYFFKFSLN